MIVGILIQRLIGKQIPALIELTEIGVSFVILSVMLPVEIKDVGRAFTKIKPTAIAIFVNFIFIPAFAWAMGWLFLKRFPGFWVGAILYTLTACIGWYLIFTAARNSEAIIGVAVAAFPGHPLVYLAILLGPIVELPMLLLLSRVLLALKERFWAVKRHQY